METSQRQVAGPRELLLQLCRVLADLASWDRSVGDDAPRFGLSFRDKADRLLAAAEHLAAHPSLVDDGELADRVTVLRRAVGRPVGDSSFTRDVIEAGHAVAEQAEDVLGVGLPAPDVIEVPPPGV